MLESMAVAGGVVIGLTFGFLIPWFLVENIAWICVYGDKDTGEWETGEFSIKEKSCYLQASYLESSIFNFIRQDSSSLLVKNKIIFELNLLFL